jgi:DNA-binding CsgD family transcriptional regulator
MAASGLLREQDLRLLTAVVEDGLRDDPGEAMPWAVLERLHQLIPGDDVRFSEVDLQAHTPVISQTLEDGSERVLEPGDDTDSDARFWALRAGFLPYSHQACTGDLISVLRWSDFYTGAELKNDPYYCEYIVHHPPVDKYCMFVPLPAAPGRTRRVTFWRSNRDFSERDRLALQLLRPHLHEVYLDAEGRRHGIPHLSRREQEVLQLVAQGYSNADIARALFISVATVAKHMEHIFDRTGVRTRSAAAALALPQASRFTGPVLSSTPR